MLACVSPIRFTLPPLIMPSGKLVIVQPPASNGSSNTSSERSTVITSVSSAPSSISPSSDNTITTGSSVAVKVTPVATVKSAPE